MRKSTITAEFKADRKTLWDIITNLEDSEWRSDLDHIEIMEEENRFIEYTKDGHWTEFMITEKEPFSQYEFDMENQHFKGHWTGMLYETGSGGTKIEFTEVMSMYNQAMELLSYLFMNLGKIQKTYVADLKRKLGEAE